MQEGRGCTSLDPRSSWRCSLPTTRYTRRVAATSGPEGLSACFMPVDLITAAIGPRRKTHKVFAPRRGGDASREAVREPRRVHPRPHRGLKGLVVTFMMGLSI